MEVFLGVSDTLFIPLAARIFVSKKFPDFFYDEKALSLEHKIPYDLIKSKSSEYNLITSVIRYYNADRIINDFIKRNGTCNIVNLGAGLETVFYRLNNKIANFYEVDLPNVIHLRNKFFEKNSLDINISSDIFSFKWIESIDQNLPTLLIANGVFMYFNEVVIREFLMNVGTYFDRLELVFDATTSLGLNFTNRYVKKIGNSEALMNFGIDNSKEFFSSFKNIELIYEKPFFNCLKTNKFVKLNLYTKLSIFICNRINGIVIYHLKFI